MPDCPSCETIKNLKHNYHLQRNVLVTSVIGSMVTLQLASQALLTVDWNRLEDCYTCPPPPPCDLDLDPSKPARRVMPVDSEGIPLVGANGDVSTHTRLGHRPPPGSDRDTKWPPGTAFARPLDQAEPPEDPAR